MKKVIYMFFGLILLALAGFFLQQNITPAYIPPSTKAPRVVIAPELNPQFVSLRFENVGNKELPGIKTIPAEKLEECLKYLIDNHYHFLSAKEVYDFVEYKVPVPGSSVWLSFDQGMESAWSEATPLLKKYKARATLFIAVSWIRDNYRLTNNQLKQMSTSGVWDIQTHGFTGGLNFSLNKKGLLGSFYSNQLWQIDRAETIEEYRDRIKKDFKQASSYLHKYLNSASLLFSYPFSQSLNEMQQDLKKVFLSCLDDLKIAGIGTNETGNIYTDFSTKKHYLSRYDINKYTDLQTIMSINFTGKRISSTDKYKKVYVFSYITPFKNGNYLCWNDSGNFAIAESNFNISEPMFSLIKFKTKKALSSKPCYLCTTSGNNIILADNANNILLILGAEKKLLKKIPINKNLRSVWVYNDNLYFLDDKGIIYTMKSSPIPLFDTGIKSKSLWACANGGTSYVFDDFKKAIYKIDYLKRKIIETIPYPSDFSLIPQYALASDKLICRESERNVFVTVELNP